MSRNKRSENTFLEKQTVRSASTVPRSELVLRLFVAAPDALDEEVLLLSEVVEELNHAHSRDRGFRLEVVHWRTDVIPALGTDPQAIINSQIGGEYDIFIGILWTRFGSPTPRAKSGFEEEFENACRSSEGAPSAKSVMLYFKTALVAPESIDLDQLKAVREFRNRIKDKALYYEFADRDSFSNGLRLHLGRQLQSWAGSQKQLGSQPPATTTPVPAVIEATASNGEEGFLDLLEIFEAEIAKATIAAEQIGELQKENGIRTQLNTKQLSEIAKEPTAQRNRLLKQLFNVVAGDLNSLSKGLNEQAAALDASFAAATEAMSKALGYQEFWDNADSEQRANSCASLRSMDPIFSTNCETMSELAKTIADLPRVTTMFNRSKKNATEAIERVRSTMKRGQALTADLLKSDFWCKEATV